MRRPASTLVAHRHEALLPRTRELKAEPPFWGYRRLWAYLPVVERQPVPKKRGRRVRREHGLLVPPHLRLQAKRTPGKRTPKPTKPQEWWGLDMTKVLVQGFGWVSIVVVLDWSTNTIVGHEAGMQGTAQHGLLALDMAVNRQFPEGVAGKGLALMRETGCQPTSTAWMRAGGPLGSQQAFTSSNNPQGNADTERVIRTLKEAGLWLPEGTCPCTLARALETGMADDHEHDLQAALGAKPPRQCERDYDLSHGTQFVAA